MSQLQLLSADIYVTTSRTIHADSTSFMFVNVIIYLFINLLSMAILAADAAENGMATRWHRHFRQVGRYMVNLIVHKADPFCKR